MREVAIVMKLLVLGAVSVLLVACGKPEDGKQQDGQGQQADQAYQVKPAAKLSTDASAIARETLTYLQQAEPALEQTAAKARPEALEKLVFAPVRDLLLHWRTDVKQTDSVVGDQYTICRGALMSFDAWARALLERPDSASEKKQVYLNQKQLCTNMVAQDQPSEQS